MFCYEQVSTKFSDLFAFGGPAPKRINARLSMVGFVAGRDAGRAIQGTGFVCPDIRPTVGSRSHVS
jgi:hypothetical protein